MIDGQNKLKSLKKSLGATHPVAFVFDKNASIEQICSDIIDYAHQNLAIDKIAMTAIIDPATLGSNVRDELMDDEHLETIVRSLDNALKAGRAKSSALREAVILLDMGNGMYLVVDGNHRYFAVKRLGWDLMPKAAILPYEFFKTHGIDMDILQCDVNPQAERLGMKLGELLERVEKNWNGSMIQGNKQRAFDWIRKRNLGSFTDKTLNQRLNGIERRVKAKASQAKKLAALNAATPHQPNFYNWTAGTDTASRQAAFNTHNFIDKHCKAILSGGHNYYSFNASDSAMQSKVLGTMVGDLKTAGTHLKDIVIGDYNNKPIKRKNNIAFLNVLGKMDIGVEFSVNNYVFQDRTKIS